ncbi:MAG: ribonuclease H [Planctomycetota bacterium]
MPTFRCQTCQTSFSIAAAKLARFPGWTPRFCQAHSPTKPKSGRARGSSGTREENLTPKEVLERYTAGPDTGVFTDGSAVPNPGPGGWGMVWVERGEIRAEDHGHAPMTTNNRMELTALLAAFGNLPEDADLEVHTDSRLCVDTITKWAPGWERNGWKKKTGPIKNLELVQELLALARERPRVKLVWIAAHSGNRWNEYADSLASAWRRDGNRRG